MRKAEIFQLWLIRHRPLRAIPHLPDTKSIILHIDIVYLIYAAIVSSEIQETFASQPLFHFSFHPAGSSDSENGIVIVC